MFALTFLYCIIFFYIRKQVKNFHKTYSSTEGRTTQEDQNWQARLEAGTSTLPASAQQILTTQTVTVITEDRPKPIVSQGSGGDAHRRINRMTRTLLFYPIIYICLTLPLAISRISEFAGKDVPFTTVYICVSLYSCSGWVNVLLYTATRKGIISWNWLCSSRRRRTVETPRPPHYRSRIQSSASISGLSGVISVASNHSLESSAPSNGDMDYGHSIELKSHPMWKDEAVHGMNNVQT
jgi:hypothetical protein